MSHSKQFTLYTHITGPNGWKVVFVLEALGLTYHSIYLDFAKNEHKAPAHTQHNPNGRIPTLIDHQNGDFVIWESNAIILYLVARYDTQKRLTYTDDKDQYNVLQWLFFQASGQAPYFGQAHWFMYRHEERFQSAIERYHNETLRVLGVLDGVLAVRPSGWLVGDKYTIADLSFVPWNRTAFEYILPHIEGGVDVEKRFPAVYAWHKRLLDIDSVKRADEIRVALAAAQ